MKRYIKNGLLMALAAGALVSCKDNEAYESSVTRELSMTLDGKPWNIYYNTNNRPLFIYGEDGTFNANYSTSYRFALDDGKYKIFATNQADLITPPTNLNDQVIEQDPETKQTFAISDVTDYNAGAPISLALKTRTGMLRLKALDTKADKSYSNLRATITTPVRAYKVSTSTPVTGDPLELVRQKETSGGGIGYTEDAVLIGSKENPVKVRIDYLDADNNLVRSKEFSEAIPVLPNDTTEVTFNLNNPDEMVILNYTITMASTRWSDVEVYPSVKVEVPEGFTYVAPEDNITEVYTALKNDDTVDEIKLFLKANSSYALTTSALDGISKPLTIVGQTPGYGQTQAQLSMGAATMTGEFDHIRFENLTLKPATRMFNLRNQSFKLNAIELINCTISDWNGIFWYQVSNSNGQQTVNNVVMDGCRLINYTATSNALWMPASSVSAPILNWKFTNNVFHGKNWGTKNEIISNLAKMQGNLTILIEGNYFIDTKGSAFTYFNIDCAAASSASITVKNNILSGAKSGFGTWFKLGKYTNLEVSGNTRTAGYTMSAWGVDTPAESATTYEQLLNQLNL